jgi:hypothetical protein
MLEGGALSDPAFPEFAKSVVLFLHNTSRVEGEKYGDLLREKEFRGFPTLAFMDAGGKVLTSRVDRSVRGFQETAAALARVQDMAKAEAEGKLHGDAAASYILAQLDLGALDAAAAKAKVDAIEGPITDANKKALAARLTDLEVAEITQKHQQAANAERVKLSRSVQPGADGTQPDPAAREAALAAMRAANDATQDAIAKDYAALLAAGRTPSDKAARTFWNTLLRSAERNGDEAMQKRARSELEALAERVPAEAATIRRMLDGAAGAGAVRAVPVRPAGQAGKDGAAKSDKKDGK